jgi:hypothetical protein
VCTVQWLYHLFFQMHTNMELRFVFVGLEVQLLYEGVSRSIQTGRLERELQMVQLSATMCSCIAIL